MAAGPTVSAHLFPSFPQPLCQIRLEINDRKFLLVRKIPPSSSRGLGEMGYTPPAFLASEENVGGIIPLKIPPTLNPLWRIRSAHN